jgi:hypothetical protein
MNRIPVQLVRLNQARHDALSGVIQHQYFQIRLAAAIVLGALQRHRKQGQLRTRRPHLADALLGIHPVAPALILEYLAGRMARMGHLDPGWQLLSAIIGVRQARQQQATKSGGQSPFHP